MPAIGRQFAKQEAVRKTRNRVLVKIGVILLIAIAAICGVIGVVGLSTVLP